MAEPLALNLVAAANGYPSDAYPQRGAFDHGLFRELCHLGAEVTVVAPQKRVGRNTLPGRLRLSPVEEIYGGVAVHRPRYFSYSNRTLPFGLSTYRWTVSSFTRTVLKHAQSLGVRPDLCYGQFLYPGGVAAQRLARRMEVPAVLLLGEGSFKHYENHFGLKRVRETLAGFEGAISVSESIRNLSIERYGVSETRVKVFPNAAASHFYPRPRDEMRRKLGLPLDRPIVGFVGHFDDNKGSQRVLEAIRVRPDIGAFFLGSGALTPTGPQVLYAGLAANELVPEWLSAADLYVQPVYVEASSNSMKEAMACGLPIVSSDLTTNREFLDESMATLVDPGNIVEIRGAILALLDDPRKRASMSMAALERTKRFSSIERSRKILEWFEEIVCS